MPYPYNPHDVITAMQHFLLFWTKSKMLRVGLCNPKHDLQHAAVPFTFTLALSRLLRPEHFAKTTFFSNNHIYIDLIKVFLI